MRFATFVLLTTLAAVNSAAQKTIDDGRPNPDVALAWLPPDTESLMVSRGPFELPDHDELEERSEKAYRKRAALADVRLQLQTLPLEVVAEVVGEKLFKAMQGNTASYVLQASRHFRDPRPNSEVMSYEGCSVIFSPRPLTAGTRPLKEQLLQRASRSASIAGATVLAIREPVNDESAPAYYSLPRPGVALFCNSLPFLQTILERMHSPQGPRALPDHLPEWRYIDRRSTFWALRHYDATQAGEDVTSPLREQTAQNDPDEKAVGIVFACDAKRSRRATMIMLTGNDARVQAATGPQIESPQEGVEYSVTSRRLAPGVLERAYTLDRHSTLDYYMLAVIVSLGRGMYF